MGRRRRKRQRGGSRKSVLTAIVLVPPGKLWGPIQAIRSRYDRRYHRWMPHITLIFPFVPELEIPRLLPGLTAALADVVPFRIRLERFRYFRHPSGTATVWLAPVPAEPVGEVQWRLQQVVPWCDDQRRHPEGFTPHLSVGQAMSWEEAERLVAQLQRSWSSLEFHVDHVSIVVRGPTTPFREAHRLPFGARDGVTCP